MNARLVQVVLLILVSAVTAQAAVVKAWIVLAEGDPLGGSTVSTLNSPFTDGVGRVGFVGSLADNQRFIWWDTGPVFFSGSIPGLTGGEGTMGVSDAGGFIYSPNVDGNDAVVTHGGVLLKKGDPVPPLPGLYSSFNSRPMMLPNGTAFWVGGTATSPTGSTSNRHLFKAADPTDPQSITRVLGGGDVIEGKTIKTSASNFNYWISDNGEHHIHVLDMDVPLNEHVYVDGAFVAQEGSPTGQGDNWSSFDIVSINNAGKYIFTGDTDGPANTDEFIAYNGVIAVREGDTLDGVTLASGYTLRAASINNLNQVAHIWGSSTTEHLFFGDGADLLASVHLLGTGDGLDVDGDGQADYTVTDFAAASSVGPGLSLAENGYIYVEVEVTPVAGGTEFEAIIGISLLSSGACCFHDGHCEQLSQDDCTAAGGAVWRPDVACEPNPCFQRADLNCDGAVNVFDIDPFVLALTSGPGFEAYFAEFQGCDPLLADVNCDGAVNVFDIDPFVLLLTSR